MTTLADMPFEDLLPGMKFRHPDHGEQIVLDLGRGQLGPAIKFDNCPIYSGELPQLDDEEQEGSIFEVMAQHSFPYGAENWEYLGVIEPERVATCGWQWFEVQCPHCGHLHRQLSAGQPSGQRQCRECGMVFSRPAQPANL